MTEVVPFRGILYNREKVAGDDVIAPPYDVITPGMREEFYAKSPYNIVKVDAGLKLPGDTDTENKYTRAAAHMEGWLSEGVMVRDPAPAYYVCGIEYTMDGEKKTLFGLFGSVRLVELGKGVYPHEATHSKPKKDRLSLTRHTGANTSPIYSLYSGAKADVGAIVREAAKGEPDLRSTDSDGTVHSFWPLRDNEKVEAIRGAMSEVEVFIADGHHRYETAIEYQKIMRKADGDPKEDRPYDFVLMFLADVNDPGLAVLPTHRLVTVDTETMAQKLEKYFEIREISEGVDVLGAIEGRERTFGLYDGENNHMLKCKGECPVEDVDEALGRLDVVMLHKLIFGKLLELGGWSYEMDAATVRRMVDEGEFDAAFFLNPTRISDVERVALKSLRMPPKSTYFYPKVQTGFVINDLKTF